MQQQERYCRSCGQELQPEDRFCAGCGRPVHATAQVPTPEADVPVPPPPQQAEAVVKPSLRTEQAAAPSPQPQQRLPWRWGKYGEPIFYFLGSVIVSSVLSAVVEAPTSEGNPVETVAIILGFALARSLHLLLIFIPIWLALGVLAYLVARRRGGKPRFFQVVFGWSVTGAVIIPILLLGLYIFLYF